MENGAKVDVHVLNNETFKDLSFCRAWRIIEVVGFLPTTILENMNGNSVKVTDFRVAHIHGITGVLCVMTFLIFCVYQKKLQLSFLFFARKFSILMDDYKRVLADPVFDYLIYTLKVNCSIILSRFV